MIPKYNLGNYPNSLSYDDNVPIGWNKWDDEPNENEENENIKLENESEGEIN